MWKKMILVRPHDIGKSYKPLSFISSEYIFPVWIIPFGRWHYYLKFLMLLIIYYITHRHTHVYLAQTISVLWFSGFRFFKMKQEIEDTYNDVSEEYLWLSLLRWAGCSYNSNLFSFSLVFISFGSVLKLTTGLEQMICFGQ